MNDPHFDGETYVPKRDHVRLTGQLYEVWSVMKDGRWRSLHEIHEVTGIQHQSVSARLRDFRKEKFGGHEVDRMSSEPGHFLYRLIVRNPANDRQENMEF